MSKGVANANASNVEGWEGGGASASRSRSRTLARSGQDAIPRARGGDPRERPPLAFLLFGPGRRRSPIFQLAGGPRNREKRTTVGDLDGAAGEDGLHGWCGGAVRGAFGIVVEEGRREKR